MRAALLLAVLSISAFAQQAYDWARVSMIQGMVNTPYLGTGLIAGYRTSGDTARPGFAWFFGRDALRTSFALNAEGDFADTRTALDFLSHYQRTDGKVPHEISQSATLVPWFTDYPHPYRNSEDQHLVLRFPVRNRPSTLRIRVRNDFGYDVSSNLPPSENAVRV